MKPAMMGMIGPMALLLATLTAIAKASSGASPSGGGAGGSKKRTGGTSSVAIGSNPRSSAKPSQEQNRRWGRLAGTGA
jgi:hypothetical protein